MEIEYNEKNEIDMPISRKLDRNIEMMETLFADADDMVWKRFELERSGGRLAIYILYIDGMSDGEMVERTITRPLLYEWRGAEICKKEKDREDGNQQVDGGRDSLSDEAFHFIFHYQTASVDMKKVDNIKDVLSDVFKLTEEEKRRLANFPVGQGLFFAGQNHVHIQIIASETEEGLITTNPAASPIQPQ